MTADAAGTLGQVRRDPLAMLPFCGYNMVDYYSHWLYTGKSLKLPPRNFNVNWFRKDAAGKFLWPGYMGEKHVGVHSSGSWIVVTGVRKQLRIAAGLAADPRKF